MWYYWEMPKRRVTRRSRELSVNPKVRENRIRAKAERYGLRLTRSRQRDGVLVGTYGLVNEVTQEWALAGPLGYGKSLDEVEAFLQTNGVVSRG